MPTEIIEQKNNKSRSIYVELLSENMINIHTKHKKDDLDVQMYIFNESELSELINKQEEIYREIENRQAKKSNSVISLLRNIIEKIIANNTVFIKKGTDGSSLTSSH